MRKIILAALAATTLMPVAAGAQSYGEVRRDQHDGQDDHRGRDGDHRDGQRADDHRDGQRYDAQRYDGQRYDDHRDGQRYDGQRYGERRDAREDWRGYRDSHPDAFRRGGYRGPVGYRYRPVTPGYRFAPGYYSRNYWLNDWQTYRLARPLGYQRWVRYGNDVVLVDVRTGAVVSVYNGFFY